MKNVIILAVFLAGINLFSQDLYDLTKVYKMKLEFYDSNYLQLLKSNYETETDIPARLIVDDTIILDSIGVRYKGNSSYNVQSNKKSFNLSIDAYREEQRLFGYKTLNLNNGFVDPTYMRETIVNQLFSRYMPSLKTGYVYLYVNDEEYGLYTNIQQLNKDFLGQWYKYKSGNLYKGDPRGELSWKGNDASLYKNDYEKKTNEESDDWSDLVNLINTINNSKDFRNELPKVLNVDRALWYFALLNIFVNLDSYIFSSHNYYLYNNPSGNLFDFLLWDVNESFGTFPPNLPITKTEFPIIDSKAPNKTPLLKNMMNDSYFKQVYFAHYRTILYEIYNADTIMKIINMVKPVIEDYVKKDPLKIYSYNDFIKNITDDVVGQGRTIYGLTSFVNKRRTYLMKLNEFKVVSPEITDLKCLNEIIEKGKNADFNVNVKSDNLKNVYLHFRLIDGNFGKIEMFDDGKHNDGAANDKIFGISVNIPAELEGDKIDFYATATDNNETIAYYPERAEFVFLTKDIKTTQSEKKIVINEFMASNFSTISDESGEFDDWIELYNPNSTDISINGWYITDDITKKTKWQFPDVTIKSDEYLLLWADEDKSQGNLHCNFKLSKSGEYIGLYDNDGNLVDEINFGEQSDDISEGRYPNGTGNFTKMPPTPKSVNIQESSIYDQNWENEIIISPNPSFDNIIIKFSSEFEAFKTNEILILNLFGECMEKLKSESNEINININGLSSGIYYIRIGNKIKKFVKL